MRATLATVAVASALLVAAAATTTAIAQDGGDAGKASPATSDEALIERLVTLEEQLPVLPPTSVELDEDTTWGELQGDFFSAATELELISADARQLFADADDADGDAAGAVAAVARSYLELGQGFAFLADYEEFDLERPLGTFDADGVATGADTATGLASTGLSMVETARVRALAGYSVLRDTGGADDAAKGLFAAAFDDAEQFLDVTRPQIHEMVSLPSVGVLVAVERFQPGPDDAHATDAEYVCLDRVDYPETAEDAAEQLLTFLDEGLQLSESVDCPDFANSNEAVTSAA